MCRESQRTAYVWDPVVRISHWLVAVFVLLAWFTRHGKRDSHETVGYIPLGVLGIRLLWGRIGPVHARFASFLRGVDTTLMYARELWHEVEPRYIGHNPLGAWMIVALMATVTLVCVSGWLYTTDRFWGIEWVGSLHDRLADILWFLVGLHVAGVIFASVRHRENLIAAMIHGRKRVK